MSQSENTFGYGIHVPFLVLHPPTALLLFKSARFQKSKTFCVNPDAATEVWLLEYADQRAADTFLVWHPGVQGSCWAGGTAILRAYWYLSGSGGRQGTWLSLNLQFRINQETFYWHTQLLIWERKILPGKLARLLTLVYWNHANLSALHHTLG